RRAGNAARVPARADPPSREPIALDDRFDLDPECDIAEWPTPHLDHSPHACQPPNVIRRLVNHAIRRNQFIRTFEFSVPHPHPAIVHGAKLMFFCMHRHFSLVKSALDIQTPSWNTTGILYSL